MYSPQFFQNSYIRVEKGEQIKRFLLKGAGQVVSMRIANSVVLLVLWELKSKRQKLINPHYFCGTSYEENNTEFWDEIYEYISNHYDLDKVKKIYLSSDGGAWIKSGMKRIAGITYVLDEFHLEKYLTKLTSHMKDSKEDTLDELRTAIRSKTKQDFEKIVDRLKSCLEDEAGLKRIAIAKEYILSNWMAAKLRLRHQNGVKGSSTEGHVSHVLSSRMSSRPMGWSIKGDQL